MRATSAPTVARQGVGIATRRRQTAFLIVAGAAIVVCRTLYVSHYAAAIPYWDQWDAIISQLLVPFAQHRLGFAALFAPFNEHRILFTRLWSLAWWAANGRVFDNRIECYANILLALAVFVVFARLVRTRTESAAARWAAPGLLALVLCLPIGWANFLVGFQSQFYFAALAALWVFGLLTRERFTWREGIPACMLALAAMFTMASGLFTAWIACALVAWRTSGSGPRERTAILLPFVAVAVFGVAIQWPGTSPAMPHSGLMAHVEILLRALGWPAMRPGGPLFLIAWLPLIVALPKMRSRLQANPGAALFLALAAWSLLAAGAIAASRTVVASRYSIALVFGLLANAVFACELLRRRPARWKITIAAAFGLYIVAALTVRTHRDVRQMHDRYAFSQVQTQRLTLFERTRDMASLRVPQPLQIPYYDAARLTGWLQTSQVLALLPAPLSPRNATAPFSRWADAMQDMAGGHGQWLPAPLRAIQTAPDVDRRLSCSVDFVDDRAPVNGAFLSTGGPMALTGTAVVRESRPAQLHLVGARNYALDVISGIDKHGYVAIAERAPPPGRYAIVYVTGNGRACGTGASLIVQAPADKS